MADHTVICAHDGTHNRRVLCSDNGTIKVDDDATQSILSDIEIHATNIDSDLSTSAGRQCLVFGFNSWAMCAAGGACTTLAASPLLPSQLQRLRQPSAHGQSYRHLVT